MYYVDKEKMFYMEDMYIFKVLLMFLSHLWIRY